MILGACETTAEEVVLYTDPGHRGEEVRVSLGAHNGDALGTVGENNVSSLRVPAGRIVRLSENPDGSGWNWLFHPGTHEKIGGPLDNATSRVEVDSLITNQLQRLVDEAIAGGTPELRLKPNTRYEIPTTLQINDAPGGYGVIVHNAEVVRGRHNRILQPGSFFAGSLLIAPTVDTDTVSVGVTFSPGPKQQPAR